MSGKLPPIDGLNIDRSFIKDMVADSDSKAIAAVVVSLVRGFGLAIVVEGVETEEQRQVLCNMGGMLIRRKPGRSICSRRAVQDTVDPEEV